MKLKRSHDHIIAGVCGGLAEALGWDYSRTRIVYLLLTLLSAAFPGLLLYIALWFLMPPPAQP